ncbi:hypothetical protein [Bacillus xiapuensis]|uniref:hypothetical protein n=1 Tax=Bacillus xiapuensis TaxID=2014075 RepID=UPI000C23F99F|nr:hypothetical protein [Bacillus xiapuensis]
MNQEKTAQSIAYELANVYAPFFNVERCGRIGQTDLAFSACYHRKDERYVFTKKVKVWEVENQQKLFAAAPVQQVTAEFIERLKEDMLAEADKWEPEQSHMSTVCMGIILTDQPVGKEVIRSASKFRKLTFLKWGARGWMEMYVAVLDLHKHEIYVHRKGRPFIKPFITYIEEGRKQ